MRQRDGRHRRWWRRRKRKRRGEAWTGRGEEIAEFGEVDGEVDVALGAAEASEAMGHIEDGLAARARQLDLRGVHALRSRRGAAGRGRERSRRRRRLKLRMRLWLRRRSRGGLGRGRGHELGGEALRHAALGADELGHAGGHGEDAAASGAAHLDGRGGRGGGGAAGHRRRGEARRPRVCERGRGGQVGFLSLLAMEKQEQEGGGNRNGRAGGASGLVGWSSGPRIKRFPAANCKFLLLASNKRGFWCLNFSYIFTSVLFVAGVVFKGSFLIFNSSNFDHMVTILFFQREAPFLFFHKNGKGNGELFQFR